METAASLKESCLVSFKLIYYRYHEKLYSYILKKTSSAYLAEEVVQKSFIRLWENREILPEDVPVNVQLFRMARTILIDELRKESVRFNHLNLVAETSPAFTSADPVAEKDVLRHVYLAIEQLPPIRKNIFKLSRFNGLSNKEIAEMLDLSPKTVENHIYNALKQLKACLGILLFMQIFP
ncbi:RNA polymerase sigma-70 factor [Desertivirga brevis]|uniref:RNA polymerase sigma-70 factor n=1 Tax=Desertivirga brevis TaxID=2810310 RepID=UPI001A962CF9|nr:RNA polymerase sigma-70 factor [Pedobacter sp. SYSU D00873]